MIFASFRQKLKDVFQRAAEPEVLSQSEFFGLRAEGLNPIPVKEAKERIARDGEKANAIKIKVDRVYMYVENIPLWP